MWARSKPQDCKLALTLVELSLKYAAPGSPSPIDGAAAMRVSRSAISRSTWSRRSARGPGFTQFDREPTWAHVSAVDIAAPFGALSYGNAAQRPRRRRSWHCRLPSQGW
jgi:hypothetical protein